MDIKIVRADTLTEHVVVTVRNYFTAPNNGTKSQPTYDRQGENASPGALESLMACQAIKHISSPMRETRRVDCDILVGKDRWYDEFKFIVHSDCPDQVEVVIQQWIDLTAELLAACLLQRNAPNLLLDKLQAKFENMKPNGE